MSRIITSGNEPEFFVQDIEVQTMGSTTRLICTAPSVRTKSDEEIYPQLVFTVVVPSESVPVIVARLRGLTVQAAPADDRSIARH